MRHSAISLACACLLVLAAAPLVWGSEQTGAAAAGAARAAAAGATGTVPAAEAQATGEPATWITRDVEVNLQKLPKTYTCDALWYKLHGILLAIGARQYMSITPYNCGRGAASDGRSPTLDLKFQTLRALSGANARWAETTAVRRTVRLGPGEPKTLEPGDCALLAQLEGTLFAYLGMHVVATNLECSSPRGASRFSLSVEALAEKTAQSSGR